MCSSQSKRVSLPARCSLLLLCCLLGLVAAAPLAGSRLNNQATFSYVNTQNGLSETLVSNLVNIVVLPQEALSLTSDQTLRRPARAVVNIPHRLTNTGNTPLSATLTFSNQGDDGFDLAGLSLVIDLNSNGIADDGEPRLSSGGSVSLNPDEAINLVLLGTIPALIPVDQAATVSLLATSDAQHVQVSNTDTVITVDGAVIPITKRASTLTPQPRDIVTFTLSMTNTGTAATGIPVVVDGAPVSLVVVRDTIPANTGFVSLTPAPGLTSLYHRVGDPEHTYTSAPTADLDQVDAIGLGIAQLESGESLMLSFQVVVKPNASGPIVNTGVIHFHNGTVVDQESSNTVVVNAPEVLPTIHYYSDGTFSSLAAALSIGQPLFVQADAAACNTDATTIETHLIIITSELTQDVESFEAIESAPNSGQFRIVPAPPTQDVALNPVQPGNGTIETQQNDSLTATLQGCGSTSIETVVLIDPFGIVFDSKTNVPVAGAVVTLIDVTGEGNGGDAGGLATVFALEGAAPPSFGNGDPTVNASSVTPRQGLVDAPSTLNTGTAGTFAFPLVFPSQYRLQITPPDGYIYPSVLPSSLLAPNRIILSSGSYGGTFTVDLSGPVRLDIPLDREGAGGLLVQKRASKSVIEIGDFLDYTVDIKNTREAATGGVVLTDTLPAGFALQPGSVRLDDVRQDNPPDSPGPILSFSVGTIPGDATVTLTYRIRVGPGALEGDGVNRAQAHSAPPLPQVSNIATAKVEIRDDVFSDKGFILGKVYLDCNRNHLQDAGEVGIPGVRVYLENGTFAITDGAGKYNFFGVVPQTHVLKLDATSMPPESRLEVLSNRHAGNPASRFVDLKRRELHKADFAESSCSPAVLEAVEARRAQSAGLRPETEKNLTTELVVDENRRRVIDPRKEPSSGLLEGEKQIPRFEPVAPRSPGTSESTLTVLPPEPDLDGLDQELVDKLPSLSPELGFIDLNDGDILPIAQTNIRVKGQAQTTFVLMVNELELTDSRVGQKSVDSKTGVQAWEYVGVTLQPGPNDLTLVQRDAFGNERERAQITVIAPDKLGVIHIIVPKGRTIADGRTPAPITIQLEDIKGRPVTVPTPVTLDASLGSWEVTDLDPVAPGLQVFVEGGSGTFPLRPPHEPGESTIYAATGVLDAEATVSFLPELRPLIAVGMVEGIINISKKGNRGLLPIREQDSFERELRELTFSEDDGKVRGGGRAAFFLKGKVKGDYLLTMAYDSDKDTQERLFRDIQPDRFYPVYGDASVRGFDAQSTGRFFVRIDKNRSYLLYGDFTTETLSPARQLGQFSRSQTGAKLHYENKHVSLNAFGSQDDTRQVVDELPGRGISGPYTLNTSNIIENSEKVEILTRDRDQPDLILNIVPQVRFEDYEFDPLSGSLLFRGPVSSVDLDLNPISIRITYEVEQGGKDFWVAGVDGQVRVTDHVEVGGSYVRDENPQDRFEMFSGNATVKLSKDTYVIGEVATTDRDGQGTGIGWRADLHHKGEKLEARAHVARTDEDFDNPSGGIARGRLEARAQARYKLTDRTKLSGEVLHTEDLARGGKRDGGELAVNHSFGQNMFAELGVRHTRETEAAAQTSTIGATPFESTSLRTKLGAQMPFLPQLSLFGEYEQDVQHFDRRVAALGGEYSFLRRGRVYARHEFISSLNGPFSLNSRQSRHSTLAGVDFDYTQNGQVFSEYRIRDAVSGRDAQAAIGLRHRFRLAEGLFLHAGIERIQTVEGPNGRDGTSLTGSLAYTAHRLWKGTARLELRESPGNNSLLNTLGLAYKLHRNWTLLGKHTLSATEHDLRERLRIGAAFRDTDTNVWSALFRYEFKYESEERNDTLRHVHILASHLNYQPLQPLILSAYVASKWVIDHSNGIRSTSNTHLLSNRVTYDLTAKWDAGFSSSALFSDAFRRVQYGLGLEAGYRITTDLWASVGYNFFGFYDDDLAGVNYTNPGVFFRFRYKFDEDLIHTVKDTVSNAWRSKRTD